MLIKQLHLKNWRNIPELQLDFQPGMNLIYGHNEIGKSSIIKAIRAALLDKILPSEVPWGTKTTPQISLLFESNDKTLYKIIKTPKDKEYELYMNEVLFVDGKKVQDELFKRIGISKELSHLYSLLFIEQGDALTIFTDKNFFDPNRKSAKSTKSFIKDVVKENLVSQKSRDFEKALHDDFYAHFKQSNQEPRSNSAYTALLNQEETLRADLNQITHELEGHEQLSQQFDTLLESNNALQETNRKTESLLEKLKIKKEALDQLEKKELEFKQIKTVYDQILKLNQQLEELEKTLPTMYQNRILLIQQIKHEMEDLKKDQSTIKTRIELMTHKKNLCDQLNELKREFKFMDATYKRLVKSNEEINTLKHTIPTQFAINHARRHEKIKHLLQKLDEWEVLQTQLAEQQDLLDTLKPIDEKIMTKAGTIHKKIQTLEAKIQAATQGFKLSLTLEPKQEVKLRVKQDDKDEHTLSIHQSTHYQDFQELSIIHEAMDIHVAGVPTTIDLPRLKQEFQSKRKEMQDLLTPYNLEHYDELEPYYKRYEEARRGMQALQDAIKSTESTQVLHEQKTQLELEQHQITKQITELMHKLGETFDEQQALQASTDDPIPKSAHDELTQTLTKIETKYTSLTEELKGKDFAAYETEYKQKLQAIQEMENQLKLTEPIDVLMVTQENLDKQKVTVAKIEKQGDYFTNELTLLETMQIPASSEPLQESAVPVRIHQTAQNLRDTILDLQFKQSNAISRKAELLNGLEFKQIETDYLTQKQEVHTVQLKIQTMEPVTKKSIAKVDIQKEERTLQRNREHIQKNKEELAKLKNQLESGFKIYAEKEKKEFEYQKILEQIREQLIHWYASKLLIERIQSKKVEAEQDILKPVQTRVATSFGHLIQDRYKVHIDDELNISIQAKTLQEAYEKIPLDPLSFGTKEQLSFLFRLAITEQLSTKEPQLMILDDTFVNTDKERMKIVLDILNQHTHTIQFLMFTCNEEQYAVLPTKESMHTINLGTLLQK